MLLRHIKFSGVFVSLVPRPFLLPLFDHVQYAKTGGKAWDKYHGSDVNVHQVDRGGRGPMARWNAFYPNILQQVS